MHCLEPHQRHAVTGTQQEAWGEGKQKEQATEAGRQESCPGNNQTQVDEEAKGLTGGSAENLRP